MTKKIKTSNEAYLNRLNLQLIVLVLLSFLTVFSVSATPTQTYLTFDGVNDYVEINNSLELELDGGAFTVSAWINPTGWGERGQGRIADHGGGSSGNAGWTFQLLKGNAGLFFQINNDSSFNRSSNPNVIQLNTWQHVAATFEGGTLTFYVNGVERGVNTVVPTPLSKAVPITIGRRATDTKRGFNGGIDEVRIWDRALGQSEIQGLMGNELSGLEPGLLAYYKMNEVGDQTITDSTGNGNDGVLGSNIGNDSDDPSWVTVGPPVLTTLTVSPNAASVIVGEQQQFTAQGLDQFGNPIGSNVTWSATGGTIDTTGLYTAGGTDGTFSVTASDGLVANQATITIAQTLELTTLTVSPNGASVVAGGQQQFTAQGLDQFGNPIGSNVTWSATGGTIDTMGLFTANSQITPFAVTAADGLVSGSVTGLVIDPNQNWPTNGWEIALPNDMGMDPVKLEEARDYALQSGGAGIITRGGKLVFSWGDTKRRFAIKSTTKSIGVTALGLALSDQLINIDDLAQQYLPDIGLPPQSNGNTGWLDLITIKHLATQTAGFLKPGGFEEQIFEPGTAWAYSDGGPNWLADILTVVFGEDLKSLLFNRVFTPLGISSADLAWRTNAYRTSTINGIERREIGSGISTNVDSMARIGYLYLRGGQWEGTQIIPQDFVASASTSVQEIKGLPVTNDANSEFGGASNHYGYLWWNNADGSMPGVPIDTFMSWGLGNSHIIVIPSLDIVVARAGNPNDIWAGNRTPNFYQVIQPFIQPIAASVSTDLSVLTTMTVNPNVASVIVGEQQQFTAQGLDQFGYPIGSNVTWSATGGTIDTTGLYTAGGTDGTYSVTASDGLVANQATITIAQTLELTTLTVSPNGASVVAGGQQQFTAQGLDQFGNPIGSNVTWSATGGTIDTTGLYTAGGTDGTFSVTASDGLVVNQATITITQAPELTTLTVSPNGVSVVAGGQQQFTVQGLDQFGNPIGSNVTWSATGGTIDTTGLYTAGGTDGTFSVTASDGLVANQATITITQAPELTTLTVSPNGALVVAGGQQQFTAQGLDQFGNPIGSNVTWSATGGTIDTTGLYTAGGTDGTYSVTANDGVISGQVIVTISDSFPTQTYLTFDGVNDYVEINNSFDLELGGEAFTVSAWINPTGWGERDQGRIADHGGGSSGNAGWTFQLLKGNAGLFFQINNDSSFNRSSNPNVIQLNTWQHVVATFEGGTLTFYVNGVERGVNTGVPTPLSKAVPITIGRRATDTKRGFDGGIDEVRIWDRALGQSEIQGLMGSELSGLEPGLLAYYKMNEVGDQTITDSTGNGNDGVLGSNIGNDSDDPSWVTVEPPVLTTLTVNPNAASVIVGEQQQFTAQGLDQFGNPIGSNVTWSATGGTIDTTGLYTAGGTDGTFSVTASDGLVANQATITISQTLELTTLTVSPNGVSVVAGGQQQFTAQGLDQFGNPIGSNVTWSATGGTIDTTGLYTAGGTDGTFSVTASDGLVANQATITITIAQTPELTTLMVSPNGASVVGGGQQQFTAQGLDQFGNPIGSNVTWSATGGTIDTTGLYTAGGTDGTFSVTASDGLVVNQATITITQAPELTTLTVSPNGVSVVAGGQQQFTAQGLDQFGNPIGSNVTWSATGGTIDTTGLYTAGGTDGTFSVTASDGLVANQATITITQAPELTTLTVSPNGALVVAGGQQQFTAQGLDQFGNPIGSNVTWSATGGTIDTTGLYAAGGTDGTFSVTANDGVISGQVIVTISDSFPTQTYLTFDGVNDYVEINNSFDLELGGEAFTVSAWINPTGWGERDQGRIADHGGGSSGNAGWTFQLLKGNAGLFFQINNDSSFNRSSNPNVIQLNTWQHVAATFEGGTLTFYVNGVERGVNTGVPTPLSKAVPITIGRRATDTKRGFDGGIDEVRIWDRALGQSEIQGLMGSELSGLEPGLLAYYKMNEVGDQTITDSTGNGNDGVLGSNIGNDSDDPSWVTVEPPVLTTLTVNPNAASVIVGEQQQFTAQGLDQFGNPIGSNVTWSATGGTIDTTGLYTAGGTDGTFSVTASDGLVANQATITITQTLELTTLTVSPNGVSVVAGGQQQFTAQGLDQFGNPIGSNVTWSATGGTIDTTGLYTAGGTDGTFSVTASDGLVANQATITITIAQTPELTTLMVSPNGASVVGGGQQQFTAQGLDQFGNPIGSNVTWSATGGTIDTTGLYTAGGTDGTFSVTASDGLVVNQATITITQAPELTTLTVSPNGVSVVAGGQQQFTAQGLDQFGNPIGSNVTWSATGGTIDTTGLYTAGGTDGTFSVTASDGLVANQATITITQAPELTTLTVSPNGALVVAGGQQQFTAQGLDQFGNPIGSNVTWSATGGTIDTTGLYAAGGTDGTFSVTANDGVISDQVIVTISDSFPTQTYLTFDGVNDYVEINNSLELELDGGAFTVSAWINPTDWGERDQGRIADHGGGSSGNAGWTFQLVKGSAGLVFQINNDSSFNRSSNPNVIQLNTWQHVAATFEGGTLTFYVNGVEKGVSTGVPTPLPKAVPITIGRRATDTNRGFDGGIDEVRIWERALGQSEIQDLMGNELSGLEPGLLAYYKMNELGYQTITDSTGNGNDGVLGSNIGNDSDDPSWVTVEPPVLTTLTVNPNAASVIVGEQQQFTAQGLDQFGNPIGSNVTWSATGGTIDTTGLYTAGGTDGTFSVTASDGLVVNQATITITQTLELTTLTVSPNGASVVAGGQQQFTAQGLDQFGNPIGSNVTWSATGGTIDTTGLYTAGGTDGTFSVTASDGLVANQATITITQTPELTTLTVSPNGVLVFAGGQQQFTAQGLDQFGNPIGSNVTWSATGGTIDTTGLYTAGGTDGTFSVTASDGLVVNQATITITQTLELTTLTVSPNGVSVVAGGQQQFTAQGLDQFGNPIGSNVTWSATGGTIDTTGVYTAGGTDGTFSVTANDGVISDQVIVTISDSFPTQTYLTFDGVNDYVEINNSFDLELDGEAFTVSAWINPKGWGELDQGRIADHGGGSSGNAGWTFQLLKGNAGLFFQINNDSSFNRSSNPNVIQLNTWQHVAATFEGGTLTFYVNGVERGVSTGVPTPLPKAVPITIGRRATDTNRGFDGGIDEVRIWDRALGQSEIQGLMGSELSGLEPGLLAYYMMNEEGDQTITDSTGNGNDGVLGSNIGSDSDDPSWVTVGPAVLSSIEITPNIVALGVAGQQQFTARGLSQFGYPMPINPIWSATGGTIDNTGLYTAGTTSGIFNISAQGESVSGEATVTIGLENLQTENILPLGDSITSGGNQRLSYRYPLWIKLIDAGINFDYVGSAQSTLGPEYQGIQFDNDHEGHSGWRADEILNALPNWLQGYTPDVVLLHLGTNDAFEDQSTVSTVDEIEQIISLLQSNNPNVIIFLAKLIPASDPILEARIVELNNEIDSIATIMTTLQSQVIVVDQHSDFDPISDHIDGVHPNTAGEEKMAQKWIEAIFQGLFQ